ncbi:MAG TPA: aldehyde dehydrogenase family protein [Thermoanaerobaculia bacterium]|nr:aldehyde dehydrogenase family protein [Thermoanaerobaculia bacterium]
MTIDGRAASIAGTFGVVNPSTGEVFSEAPECTRQQLDDAMSSALGAYRSWSRDEALRRDALQRCAEAFKANAELIAPILTCEQGKPLAQAMAEIYGAAAWFEYTAGLEIPVEVLQDTDTSRIEVRRRPLGVVAAITPWNYPLILAVWKIAPALLAGNTVVIKPSPYTPLSTLKAGEVLRDVLPPGVVNVVAGGDDLGAWMTSHPVPRKISFTGSVATGKKVAQAAAPDLKRLTLELGGNDAAIVMPGTEIDRVAKDLFWGAFANSGQVCSAIKRLYVHEQQAPQMIDALKKLAQSVKMGDGFDEGVELGPINNRPQLERVIELVEDARDAGAVVHAGGHPRDGGGYFFEPTILSGVAEGVRIVDEEQFGPALPVLTYSDLDEAVGRANATTFGLSGSVWSSDPDAAAELAGRLECGTAWVNQHLAITPFTPFGGAKWSGLGVENGPWGLLGFTEIQTVNVKRG